MASYSEIARKKVLGVPVIYLAAALVTILAIVAWKMKPSAPAPGDVPPDAGGSSDLPTSGDFSSLDTKGTVTVVQQPAETTPTDEQKTNSDWVRTGATWLVQQNMATGTAAYSALNKYVSGVDRSFDEEALVNKVIAEKGQPPQDIAEGGNVDAKPAKKQFPTPPGTHTVEGKSDDTFAELATLYYSNSGGDVQDLIQLANPQFASFSGTFPVGAQIKIPVYHDAKNWIVTGNMTWAQAAGKNGISEASLRALNNGPAAWRNAPTLKKGQSIRVA